MTRRRSPAAAIVIAGSLALFLVVFALLVFQLRAGRDPALAASAAPQLAQPARRILHRRIVIRKVIVDVRPRADVGGGGQPAVTVASPPAARTVAQPAPAPVAPAPAPVVTRAS